MRVAFTPSVSRGIGKWSALTQKCDFAGASKYSARENLAELTAAIFCEWRALPFVRDL